MQYVTHRRKLKSPRRDRDAYRAYAFQQRRYQEDPSTSWANSVPFEDSESNSTKRQDRNKCRFKKYKVKKQEKDKAVKPQSTASAVVEKAVQEDTPLDAPLYDSTPFTSGSAYNQEYAQNYDMSGFPMLCRETYNTLQGLNPRLRLTRDIPFPGFLHSMNSILQTAIIDSVFEDGQRPLSGQDSKAQDVLPTEYLVPGPIYEFCSNISTIMTPGNQEVKVNLPEIFIPQPAYIEYEAEIPAGTFGTVDAETHNVYETQLCPYTTMTFVQQSALQDPPQQWAPLPEALVSEGGVVTEDFL